MYQYLAGIIIEIILYRFLSIPGVIIGALAILIYALYDIGFIRSIQFYRGSVPDSVIFYKEHTRPYDKSADAYSELEDIKKKFKLDSSYVSFGIYYDDPSIVKPEQCRSIIGLMKKKGMDRRNDGISSEISQYLAEKGFTTGTLITTPSVYSKWSFSSRFSMYLGIKKFYSTLSEKVGKDEEFRRSFGIDKQKWKCSVILYSDNMLTFYIPQKNYPVFDLHSIKMN